MKTTAPHRLRFSCRLWRLWSCVFGREPQESQPGSCHLARCADCREFMFSCGTLDLSLKKAAKSLPQEVPLFLEQRILNSVRRAEPDAGRDTLPWRIILSGSVAAGLAVMAFSFPKRDAQRTKGSAVLTPEVGGVAPIETGAPGKLWSLMPQDAEALLNATPLHQEAEAVYADARGAMRFLAVNFLPNAAVREDPQTLR